MKKENKTMKFVSFVLLITVLALILVAGTYAKYTSTASGSDTATVAKWDIKAGKTGEEVSITGSNPEVAFNLFETINNEDGTAETDVTAEKIAPGTSGAFELSVKNDSEVNAKYTITFNVGESNIPLEFKLDNGQWTDDLSNVGETPLNMGESKVANVQWRWAYETKAEDGTVTAGDAVDTGLGITPSAINVTATLVVTQVD